MKCLSLKKHVAQAVLLLFTVLAVSGCRKVQNPSPETPTKRGFLFFNYYVENPTQRLALTKKGKVKNKLYSGSTLKVFIWTNCLPQAVLDTFTERFGARVVLSHYETDKELHTRLAQGESYDLIMPSGFMVEDLIHEHRLAYLAHGALLNLTNVDQSFRSNVFDPHASYAIPYLWSTAGIAYNFKLLDHIPRKWGDLFEPEEHLATFLTNRISLLPGHIRGIAAALIHLGYSPNSHETNELNAAFQYLEMQARKYHFQFLRATLPEALASENVLLAQAYSFHAAQAAKLNRYIHFVLPEEGVWTTVFFFAIPRETIGKQKYLAEEFLNFLMDPFIAATVVNYSYLATTIHAARSFIEPSIKHGPTYVHPLHSLQQRYDPVGEEFREVLWKQETNDLKIPAAY